VGFKQLPSFTGNENLPVPVTEVEAQTYSQVGNNSAPPAPVYTGPTVAELEAEVNAGRSISLVDLSNAVAAERNRDTARPAMAKEKPSVLDRLEVNKARVAAQSQGDIPPQTHLQTTNREVF
jgi:hypothetical protein